MLHNEIGLNVSGTKLTLQSHVMEEQWTQTETKTEKCENFCARLRHAHNFG